MAERINNNIMVIDGGIGVSWDVSHSMALLMIVSVIKQEIFIWVSKGSLNNSKL